MPAKFHTVPPWGPSDRRLSKEAIVLQDHLLRCPTRTSEGLFPLTSGYVTVDTPLTAVEVDASFDELSAAKLFDYDRDAEVVLDRRALKTNPIRSPGDKRIPNAVKLFAAVPDSPLKIEFVALADVYSPDLADAIRSDSHYAYPEGSSDAPSKDLRRCFRRDPGERTFQGPSKDLRRSEKRRGEQRRGESSRVELAN